MRYTVNVLNTVVMSYHEVLIDSNWAAPALLRYNHEHDAGVHQC